MNIEKLQDWLEAHLPYLIARPFQIILWRLWARKVHKESIYDLS